MIYRTVCKTFSLSLNVNFEKERHLHMHFICLFFSFFHTLRDSRKPERDREKKIVFFQVFLMSPYVSHVAHKIDNAYCCCTGYNHIHQISKLTHSLCIYHQSRKREHFTVFHWFICYSRDKTTKKVFFFFIIAQSKTCSNTKQNKNVETEFARSIW